MILEKRFSPNIEKFSFREDPQIINIGKFDGDLPVEVEGKVSKAVSAKQPFLPVVIDSPGGSISSLSSVIETLRGAEIDVLTYVKGKAFSAGLILLAFGTVGMRYASPYSSGMLHEITWGKRDKISEVESQLEYGRRQNDWFFRKMADHCQHDDLNYFTDLMYESNRNSDKWLSPNEMKEHKLIDQIGTPKLQVSVNVDYQLIVNKNKQSIEKFEE